MHFLIKVYAIDPHLLKHRRYTNIHPVPEQLFRSGHSRKRKDKKMKKIKRNEEEEDDEIVRTVILVQKVTNESISQSFISCTLYIFLMFLWQ
jgi:hypothetical protein